MVNFPTWNSDCDCHNPTLLNLFISFGASVCSRMVFPPLGNCDHEVSIDFYQIKNGMSRFIV